MHRQCRTPPRPRRPRWRTEDGYAARRPGRYRHWRAAGPGAGAGAVVRQISGDRARPGAACHRWHRRRAADAGTAVRLAPGARIHAKRVCRGSWSGAGAAFYRYRRPAGERDAGGQDPTGRAGRRWRRARRRCAHAAGWAGSSARYRSGGRLAVLRRDRRGAPRALRCRSRRGVERAAAGGGAGRWGHALHAHLARGAGPGALRQQRLVLQCVHRDHRARRHVAGRPANRRRDAVCRGAAKHRGFRLATG